MHQALRLVQVLWSGDGHLAGVCVYPWGCYNSHSEHLGLENLLGAMAKRLPWQKDALEKCHGAYGKKGHGHPTRNPFRAAR